MEGRDILKAKEIHVMRKTSKNLEHAAFLVCMKDTVKYY
jgi:hypothetical protein